MLTGCLKTIGRERVIVHGSAAHSEGVGLTRVCSIAARKGMAEVHAKQSPADRLQTAWGMWRSARRMMTNLIEAENDDWTPEQVRDEVNQRMASGN